MASQFVAVRVDGVAVLAGFVVSKASLVCAMQSRSGVARLTLGTAAPSAP
jgi:hypothetical protein